MGGDESAEAGGCNLLAARPKENSGGERAQEKQGK